LYNVNDQAGGQMGGGNWVEWGGGGKDFGRSLLQKRELVGNQMELLGKKERVSKEKSQTGKKTGLDG